MSFCYVVEERTRMRLYFQLAWEAPVLKWDRYAYDVVKYLAKDGSLIAVPFIAFFCCCRRTWEVISEG